MKAEITVLGVVQGVGFRPYVAELAKAYKLNGYVRNSGGVVSISVDGEKEAIDDMICRLRQFPPPAAVIDQILIEYDENALPPREEGFQIILSEEENDADLPVFPPDMSICEDCLEELHSASDRRFRYSYISCVNCGPRYSIAEAIPYDRPSITMRDFPMCEACAGEYVKMGNRRHHAQTISCKNCGPQLEVRKHIQSDDEVLYQEEALREAIRVLCEGGILAIKGIGGYQLACRSDLPEVVERLRFMKGREKKPFAVMFHDMEEIRKYCHVTGQEEEMLRSAARPIVLLNKNEANCLAQNVDGESRFLGAFLPYTGLHEQLTEAVGPLIMTSCNVSGEPIRYTEEGVASMEAFAEDHPDAYAFHHRRIVTPLDDSLMRVTGGKPQMLRRSRGFVPMPVQTYGLGDHRMFAAGADMKGCFGLTGKERVYLSQYLGDLADYECLQEYERAVDRMERLFRIHPDQVLCDLHPSYASSAFARGYAERNEIPYVEIQHHHAHAASVMAEHHLTHAIGIVLDGTGYGTDGTIWGGEVFLLDGARAERAASLVPVKLAGGDNAAKNAAQCAACYLVALGEQKDFPEFPKEVIQRVPLCERLLQAEGLHHTTTSAGRLFDAVSALLGIRNRNDYEGECAIALENAAARVRKNSDRTVPALSFPVIEQDGRLCLDQRAMLLDLHRRLSEGESSERLALAFHLALANAIHETCAVLREKTSENIVVLSGGVFANVILHEELRKRLEADGFCVYVNEQVPGNDGGIALGQAWIGMQQMNAQKEEKIQKSY